MIYVEEIFVETFLFNLILTYIYISFINLDKKIINLIIINFIYAIFNLIIEILLNNSLIMTIILNVNYVFLLTFPENIKKYIKNIIYYFIFYFLYVGYIFFFILIFDIDISYLYKRIIIYLIFSVLLKLSMDILWKMWKLKIKYKDYSYNVWINNLGKYKMFLDTGNFAEFKGNIPVIILNEEKYIKKQNKNKKLINKLNKCEELHLNTINGHKKYKGYILEDVYIWKEVSKKKKIDKVFVTFTSNVLKDGMFDGILPFNIFIEK